MIHAHTKLLSWYKTYGRDTLPWRNTTDIYHIYLSEIMLQQTQVNRVKEEYYPQFLQKFPTLKALSLASEEEVLASWSGLGYYSRARNLYKTAKLSPDGLPTLYKELLQLPGIGKYTASAICSFGYEYRVAVVDTNIARVIKRVFALKEPKESLVWERAYGFLNTTYTKAHNLALMDLGSMVCLPKNPHCGECPLLEYCQGSKTPVLYTQTKKKVYEKMELFYGVLIRNNQIALTPSTGTMYKNMLQLPTVDPIEENLIGEFKHSYTKYRLSVNLYRVATVIDAIVWIDLDKLDQSPISSLTKKALTLIRIKKESIDVNLY